MTDASAEDIGRHARTRAPLVSRPRWAMFDILRLLAETNWLLLAFAALIFDVPRYTISLVLLLLFGLFSARRTGESRIDASISVIIPTFNGGSGLAPTIASLRRQTLRPCEIIVVDDGSTD